MDKIFDYIIPILAIIILFAACLAYFWPVLANVAVIGLLILLSLFYLMIGI